MTSPSTQNLKALSLSVFFLICCSTFSFLLNARLRLTLEYLTISTSKWEFLFHIDTLSLQREHFQTRVPYLQMILTYIVVYTLKWVTLAWNLRLEDFWYRDQTVFIWAGHHHKPSALILLAKKIWGKKHQGEKQEWEQEPNT